MGILNIKLPPYLPSILLLAAVAVALVMAYRLWRELNEDDEPASPFDLLSELEQARAAGEIDEDELRRVRESLRRTQVVADKEARTGEPPTGEGDRELPTGDQPSPPDSPVAS